jgi:hypothetical protein
MFALLTLACNRAPKNNEAIRQGVVEHLRKQSGLDVNAMNIDVTNVTYRGNEADATVAFKPKGVPGEGMSMNYTLENQSGKWVVKRRAGASGTGNPHTMGGEGSAAPQPGQLPPGHPTVPPSGQPGSPTTDAPAAQRPNPSEFSKPATKQ